MGARSRRKGIRWERECAALFTEAGIPCERNLSECRTGNVGGPGDLLFPRDVRFAAQCRVGAAPSPWAALRDARTAAEAIGADVVPVALLRRNRRGARGPEDIAVLPLRALVNLIASMNHQTGDTP